MEIMEAILTRRSIRQYTGEQVTEAELREVLRAGCHAPSANNRQPWHFIVLREPAALQRIAELHPYAQMMPKAGTCVVVCGDTTRQDQLGFLVEDCSAAMENMLLAAHGLGLATVWCGLHPVHALVEGIHAWLELPRHVVPIGMFALGHGAEQRTVPDRYDEAKVHRERW